MATSHLFQISMLVLLSSQALISRAAPQDTFPDWGNDGAPTESPPVTFDSEKAFSQFLSTDSEAQPPSGPDSFLLALEEDIELDSDSTTQVKKLSRTIGTDRGHYFYRGNLNVESGEFSSDNGGFFLFIAHIQLQQGTKSETQEVSVALCIDGKEALVTHGVLSGPITTLSVVGNLQLLANKTLTVKVTNKSNSGVTILKSSTFSAHRLQ